MLRSALTVLVLGFLLSWPSAGGEEQAAAATNAVAVASPSTDFYVFNEEKRLFASYGPSTSMGYPARLQRKFYRYTAKSGPNCSLQIHNYSIPGGQWRMPGWINCKPSQNDPSKWEALRSERYLTTVQKLIQDNPGTQVIVMAMNNTGTLALRRTGSWGRKTQNTSIWRQNFCGHTSGRSSTTGQPYTFCRPRNTGVILTIRTNGIAMRSGLSWQRLQGRTTPGSST